MIRPFWLVVIGLATGCSSAVAESVADPVTTDPKTPVVALAASPDPTVATSQPSSTLPTLVYRSEILPIEGPVRDRVVGTSWREGCPLGLDEIRYLTVSYIDFDGEAQEGELIVAEAVASDVVEIFRVLFDAEFPIERMQLVADYEADDLASMLANNTSGFNCRFVEGTSRWSEHAFGQAIDINPLINPWVKGSTISPNEGAVFADRSIEHAGGLYEGSAAVAAFESAGWVWGGSWESSKDYQHFSTSGS